MIVGIAVDPAKLKGGAPEPFFVFDVETGRTIVTMAEATFTGPATLKTGSFSNGVTAYIEVDRLDVHWRHEP